ncbi:MAG: TlpA family protein disulfide reductase [Enterocloster clostridioformis]
MIEFKPGMPIKEGVAAPDFTGELMDGTSITLSELQGKPVIINFWATWCGPCVKEMPAFERLKDDFGDKIGIIAVNCGDDAETVKDFVEENGYTFPGSAGRGVFHIHAVSHQFHSVYSGAGRGGQGDPYIHRGPGR